MAKKLSKSVKENIKRNRELLKLCKKMDPSLFANNKVWKAVAVRRNRKEPIVI